MARVSRSLHQPLAIRLKDEDAEKVRRSHALAIEELRGLPATSLRLRRNVELPDNTNVYVAHGLGRAPLWVGISAVRGAGLTTGRIEDNTASRSADASRFVVLQADDWTGTITVDLVFL